jgi:hypothetical protein
MKNNFGLNIIVSFLLLFTSGFLYAQDFDCTVLVNVDALNLDAKDRLKELKQNVEDYFNKNKFYDNQYFNETNQPGADMYKIKATLQFTFTSSNGFDGYSAQILFVSQRIIDKSDKKTNPKYTTTFRFNDERCNFNYNRSLPFIRNDTRFDSFISLLDYYAFMMLGYDQDSFFPKDDQKNRSIYFQKAIDICNKPITDRTGWTETGGGSKPSRLQLVQELLNTRFDDYRTGYFEYHWLGLDSLGTSKNAYKYILGALQKISNIKKKEVKAFNIDMFFEEKNLEISDIFLNYGDKSVYDQLILIDPSHQRIYEEAKKKAR